jgi:hypothetical protein
LSKQVDINAAKPRFGSKANVLRRETHVRFGSKAEIGLRAGLALRLFIQLCEQPHASQMQAWHRLCIDLADGGSTGGAWQCSVGLHSVAVVKLLAEFQQLSRLSAWHRLF